MCVYIALHVRMIFQCKSSDAKETGCFDIRDEFGGF